MFNRIEGSRQTVNFKYWRLRADVEQRPATVAARQWIYQADEAFDLGELPDARTAYRQGLDAWNAVMEGSLQGRPGRRQRPAQEVLRAGSTRSSWRADTTGRDLMEVIRRYQQFLEQCDEDKTFAAEIARRPHWAAIRKLHQNKQ